MLLLDAICVAPFYKKHVRISQIGKWLKVYFEI